MVSYAQLETRLVERGVGLSRNTIRGAWRGETVPRGRSRASLAAGLEWPPEHFDHVLSGKKSAGCAGCYPAPLPVPAHPAGPVAGLGEARLAQLRSHIIGPDDETVRWDDIGALTHVVQCLSDEQFRILVLSIAGDGRFAAVVGLPGT